MWANSLVLSMMSQNKDMFGSLNLEFYSLKATLSCVSYVAKLASDLFIIVKVAPGSNSPVLWIFKLYLDLNYMA